MTEYQVLAPNPNYTGRTYGVMFDHGKALLTDRTVDAALGMTVDEIAREMKAMGYQVACIAGTEPKAVKLAGEGKEVTQLKEKVQEREAAKTKRTGRYQVNEPIPAHSPLNKGGRGD